MTKIGKINSHIFLSIVICLLVFIGGHVALAEIQVQAAADRDEVAVGERFTVQVSVKSSEQIDIQDPRVPDISGFDLVSQHNSSSVRSTFVNGRMAHEITKGYNYIFIPLKEGTLSIGSFEVVAEGKVYRTQPILLKVFPQSSAPSGRGRSQGNQQSPQGQQWPNQGQEEEMDPFQRMEEEMFNQLLQRRGIPWPGGPGGPAEDNTMPSRPGPEPQLRTLPTNPNEAFFIQVEVDKVDVFENEQVTVNWYLLARGQLESLDRVKFPDLKGFWKEIIEEIPQLQFFEEIINGAVYKKALLASHALFPIKAGTSVIDEYKIKSRVRMPGQIFGFGSGKSYEYSKSSKRVEIKVKPLPIEGRPKSFTGAVGKFNIFAKTDLTNLMVNQPFSLKVRFEGAGNAKLIELPAIQWPAQLEQYDTKTEAKFFKNGTSYKEFEILMIPRQIGEVEIPKIEFSMFDPQTKKYETKATDSFKLQVGVNPNEPQNGSSKSENLNSPQASTSGSLLGSAAGKPNLTLPPLILSSDFVETSALAQTPFFWTGLFGTVFGLLLLKAQSEFGWGKRKKTLKDKINPKLKKLDVALNKKSFRQVGAEGINLYYFLIGEVSGQGGGTQEIQRLIDLMPSSLRRDYAEKIIKNFEIFQTLAFAPEEKLGGLSGQKELEKNVREAKALILKVASEAATQS